ncbi:hypothetical protein ElP_31480 [Tautonia plasticadhaerens]|uniref:Uncharacterized protein n=2 Tax=Tautonia plasticadhaerens TaxID=2527974 RepID=A0A518H336_9BACT|nr:hypothetical protein ElP_31480 [Tautonia plasticadhaerens]
MLLAFLAFGTGPGDPGWPRLSAAWRSRLEGARAAIGGRFDEGSARGLLAVEHEAEARADPRRVHPSWYVRALRREAPSVRRAVAATAPPPLGPALRRALDDAERAPGPTHPPQADALAWALALAGERLVGGPAHRDDDPPVVRAIAALDGRGHFQLLSGLGLAKVAFAGEDRHDQLRPRARSEILRPSLPTARLELVDLALGDLDAARRLAGGRLRPARLGLTSLGRLLAGVDPHRSRWALQQLPYTVAGLAGKSMDLRALPLPADDVLAWESALLRAAVVLLIREGRVDPSDLADPSRGQGGRR